MDLLFPPQKRVLGIDSKRLDNIYAYQQGFNLCWAAGIQMRAAHNGLFVSQKYLASSACGTDVRGIPFDCPQNSYEITDYLNFCSRDGIYNYCLKPKLYSGRPNLHWLKHQLENDNPILAAYLLPGAKIGHIVLITGIEYYYRGNNLYVSKFVVRDPSPDSYNLARRGRVVYRGRDFYNLIRSFWDVSIDVTVNNHYSISNSWF